MYDDPPAAPIYDKHFGYYGASFYWFAAACVIGALCSIAFAKYDYYASINAPSNREATIVDAWPYNTGKHNSGREQWEGTFRDDMTGHFYTYEMSGGLYQKFLREKSGHGIPVTVHIKPSRAGVPEAQNADNWSVLWDLVRIFSAIITAVLLILSLHSLHTGYVNTENARKEAEEKQRLRDEENARQERRMRRRE